MKTRLPYLLNKTRHKAATQNDELCNTTKVISQLQASIPKT